MMKIGILGGGTWGVALARMLSLAGRDVTVWSAIEQEVDHLASTRRHPNLGDMRIPDEICFTGNMEQACRGQNAVVFAVPSVYVRATAAKAAPYLGDGQVLVDVAKGMEPDTLLSMTGVIRDELQKAGVSCCPVALSGPTHAEEVALDMPTTIVAACEDEKLARWVQEVFSTPCMRVYTNTDVLGVELCGAMKNIIALTAGMSNGLGFGDNAKAALITRGIAELTRLGMAMGCQPQTFAGLAGVGDLVVTAMSPHSRNNRAGFLIGQGYSVEEAKAKVGMVVEGLNALPAAMRLIERYGVEMPIVETANAVVNGHISPKDAVTALMMREKKNETIPWPLQSEG